MRIQTIYLFLALIILIIISGCVQQENQTSKPNENVYESNLENQETEQEVQPRSKTTQLGTLCTGVKECEDFCNFNSLECEQYCIAHPENPTCKEKFAFVYKEGYTPLTYGQNSVMNAGCEGKGPVTFTYSPMKFEDIEMIMPLGLISPPGHITPTDHQYYYPHTWKRELKEEDLVDAYSPADGVVTSLEIMPDFFNTAKGTNLGDYRLIIHHTCTFYTIYIHLRQIPEKLQKIVEKKADGRQPVKVKAGELIGRATSFDFSAHNEDVTLQGFIIPEHYNAEPWKIHTVDPFDYFVPEVKTELLKKNLRTAEPLGGKIDYDIDGRLIGNWFVENTYGYLGVKRPDYYVTHISFAPNALDPKHFIIGLGNYNGGGRDFGAKGNTPNPKDVDISTGIVIYELLDFEHFDDSGRPWDRISYVNGLTAKNGDVVQGFLLVQLIDKRKLKLEAFPGKTKEQVAGFTEKAVIYER